MDLLRSLFLWLLLLSSVYSSSQSYDIWTTKTIDETVTVDCSASTTSSSTKPYLTTLTPAYESVSLASTTPTALAATGSFISTYITSSKAHGASPNTYITSPAASGTTLATTGKEQTKRVLPGASAVTIGGTPVSLGLSGTLVIGTHTVTLLSESSAVEAFTIGSQTVTIMPTGFEVVLQLDTRTPPLPTTPTDLIMLPGGSPITIGTVPISLGRGGTLVMGGSTQVILATKTETFTVNGQIIIASSGGLTVDLATPTSTGLTTLITGTAQFVFSTSFISIPSLTTWSETTTELPGQTTPTVLPIWPCLSLCAPGYNGIIVIPKSPLPPSTVIIPAPFNFPSLTIAPNGRPTPVSIASLSTPQTPSIVSATITADLITSTMTTVPPGFSTEEVTNLLWTANTWITTSSGGKPTIVPVLVGCPGCGGIHGGIILWNLPELPRVSFQLPGFPGLPKFHLPCIKIFGITISGDCDNPPSTDGENSNDPTSNPTHSSDGTSSSLPSSTLSCARTAAPSCSQLCQVVSVSGQALTSSCATVVCRTITACSANPTTSTSYLPTTLIIEQCAPTCSACRRGYSARSASGVLPSRTSPDLFRRILPFPSTLPLDTASVNAWFVGEVKKSIKLQMDSEPNIDISSAEEFLLSSQSGVAGHYGIQIGVQGLYGCTVVVVATPETIYMAHIWETSYNSEALFQSKALQFLARGNQARGWVGLDSLSIPASGNTVPLAREKQPTVMVIAGRDKLRPDVDSPAYGNYILRIVTYLQQKFPSQPVRLVNYKAAENDDLLEDDDYIEWGKVLVQYDPAQPDCEGEVHPTFRIWVAGQAYSDVRYMNYGTNDARVGRRGTSNGSCSLVPGQSGLPIEITVAPSVFPSYISSITLSTTKTSTKSTTSTKSSSRSTSTPTAKTSIKSTTSTSQSVPSTLRTSVTAIATSQPFRCEPFTRFPIKLKSGEANTASTQTSQDPDSGSNGNSHCQCSSGTLITTLPMMIATDNPCGYTSLPARATTTAPPTPVTTPPPNPYPYTFTFYDGGVVACQTVSYIPVDGKEVSYCAGDLITLSAARPPATTTSAAPAPTQPLTCTFCDDDFIAWTFKISGSVVPNGLPDLEHQMSGCGALTGWSVQGNTVQFNLPFIMKSGCVERAIGSAGGPSISCQADGYCFTV